MRPARLALVAVVVAAGPMLSACESANSLVSAMENLEFWDTKKKLPGDRKPVFPEGVPGVASGVPPEMVRGYREPEQGGPVDPVRSAAEATAADQSPKPKPKPQRTASKPPPKPQAPPDPYAQAAPARTAAPAPAAAQPAPQAAAPWPAQPQGAAPAAQPQAAWPGSPGAVAR